MIVRNLRNLFYAVLSYVRQSVSSTYNYERHVQREHWKEMAEWKTRLETKESDTSKK